jgi:hypothetical protein
MRDVTDLNASIVDISEVSAWYYEDLYDNVWRLEKDLHQLTPPSRATYMEFQSSKTEYSVTSHRRIGCIVTCKEIDEDERPFALHGYMLERMLMNELCPEESREEELKKLISSRKWPLSQKELTNKTLWPRFMFFASIFIDYPTDDNENPHTLGWVGAYLAEDGHLGWRVNGEESTMLAFNGSLIALDWLSQQSNQDIRNVIHGNIVLAFIPFGLALSLMNCKNVHITEDQSRPSRQILRQQARRKTPPVVYKWLSVGGIKKQADQDRTASGNKRQTRLHMVRSHWATYTADAPLFGKYTGTFFKPSFVKGSATIGQVVKGYSVTTPPTPPSPATSHHI